MLFRLVFLLVALISGIVSVPASAERVNQVNLVPVLCHAVTPLGSAPPPPSSYRCGGEPKKYQEASLWLRADAAPLGFAAGDAALLIHQSRFDRLEVAFAYRDGHVRRYAVTRGDYGDYWRVGGQLAFAAPAGDAPLASVTIRIDRLSVYNLLRARLLDRDGAAQETAAASALVGGALTLLLLAALYNLLLAIAMRRAYLVWQGGWALCMVLWGLLWSQLSLLAVPQVAGTLASQICSLLACVAVFTATMAALLSITAAPRWLRCLLALDTTIVLLLGFPLAFAREGPLELVDALLDPLVLLNLLLVVVLVAIGWRRGQGEARDFAVSWTLPILSLTMVHLFDFGDVLGGGSQIAILIASALQTVVISIAATVRLARIRWERDSARAAERMLIDLANRDPLTGLLNRRGFAQGFATLRKASATPISLLLIDVDHFKSINDGFGHDVGDEVLCRLAARLGEDGQSRHLSGRLGGEEFVIALPATGLGELRLFAEEMRRSCSTLDVADLLGNRRLTVSIGMAPGDRDADFESLYRIADQALYSAKAGGRNRVAG
ncbi:diguanylate cyclase (GGDEF)-like protein [Sphingomonas zeicaulis]|uniref:GGDEF domain-containing protein n=1 Tax=Sphingomonas zeicaulis TaxID=1632740 RepID=UPI003D1BDD41